MGIAKKWKRTMGVVWGVIILGIAGGAGLWQYHQQPSFCGLCHIMNPYVESWNGSDLLAQRHGEVGVTCLGCHEATLEQQVHEVVAFVRGDYEDPLKQRRFPMDFCTRCHEHESYEQLAGLTSGLEDQVGANPHDSHYGELECHLCHRVHRDSVDYCAGCHTWGWDVP